MMVLRTITEGTNTSLIVAPKKQQLTVPRTPKFEGYCEEIQGCVYDVTGYRQGKIFSKTTQEITEYVGKTYRNGS